jgi:Mg-chelatase subunit ChlD
MIRNSRTRKAILLGGFWLLLLTVTIGWVVHSRAADSTAPPRVVVLPKVKPSLPVAPVPSTRRPSIDLAFCLDTTGSMSGLIEGAKQKIWGIVNTVAAAQPKPELRIALVAYRDIGDSYVTRVFPFTSDLETMYSRLRSLSADGGGDTPEHVNQALQDAVRKLQWAQDPEALKILYLVGDAPPHTDYQDGLDYHKAIRQAAQAGITVNSVQCGAIEGTREIWQEIARMADGKFMAIDQSGGMVSISSPYDAELAKLSRDLNDTYVSYGMEGARMAAAQMENDEDAEKRDLPGAAERASTKAGGLYRNDSWDLVDALKIGTVSLEAMKPALLPQELKGRSVEEQRAYVEQKAKDRERIQKEIQETSRLRNEFVKEEQKKLGSKSQDAFDVQVLNALKEHGKNKGISFE